MTNELILKLLLSFFICNWGIFIGILRANYVARKKERENLKDTLTEIKKEIELNYKDHEHLKENFNSILDRIISYLTKSQ